MDKRFPEPVRDSDDGGHSPVWARSSRRRSGNPIIGLIVTLLALFGALTIALGVKERSLAAGGAVVDGWMQAGWAQAKKLTGQADEVAVEAAKETGEAAGEVGDALKAGADKTAEELKKN